MSRTCIREAMSVQYFQKETYTVKNERNLKIIGLKVRQRVKNEKKLENIKNEIPAKRVKINFTSIFKFNILSHLTVL